MNRQRMKAVCRGLVPLKMHLCFPNGLQFDLFDEEGVDLLVRAGMYSGGVAIETVTPRLQELIRKRLNPGRTMQAIFFKVCPQPGTPIFEQARQIAPAAIEDQHAQEYGSSRSWYAEAYGVNLARIQRNAFLRFYFATPRRIWRFFWGLSLRQRLRQFKVLLRLLGTARAEDVSPLPESLQPLSRVFEPDAHPVTSAVLLHAKPRQRQPRTRVS